MCSKEMSSGCAAQTASTPSWNSSLPERVRMWRRIQVATVADIGLDDLFDLTLDHLPHPVLDVLTHHKLAAVGVDHLTVLIHDVVVLDDMLAQIEVVALDLDLGILDRLGDHAVLDRHIPSRSISPEIRSEPTRRIRSSSSET